MAVHWLGLHILLLGPWFNPWSGNKDPTLKKVVVKYDQQLMLFKKTTDEMVVLGFPPFILKT